jgi:NEDD8-activating enzyme E1
MCFDCALDMFPPQVVYQECTIASTPRQPQHCIAYAKQVQWRDEYPFGKDHEGTAVKIDTDNAEHMQWIFEKARAYADKHNIKGVTLKLTQGVVKNIIPAIASTNAITAGISYNYRQRRETETLTRDIDERETERRESGEFARFILIDCLLCCL